LDFACCFIDPRVICFLFGSREQSKQALGGALTGLKKKTIAF
jgi:hypothetical protein